LSDQQLKEKVAMENFLALIADMEIDVELVDQLIVKKIE